MSDNVEVTAGSGTTIATDDVSGVHYQAIKLALGADGALDTLVDSGQQTMANSVPVVLASNHSDVKVTLDGESVAISGTVTVGSHAVTNAGTFVVQENGAALTALQLIDDAVYADDADWTDSTSKHILVGGLYQSSPQTITDGDVGPFQVDSSGNLKVNVVAGGTSGTQYDEGDTDSGITGTAILWEDESDTLATVSAASPLPVEIVAGAGSGGTASADDADFTAGSTSGTPAMGVYESSPSSVTDGDMGIVGITETRALRCSVENTLTVASHAVTNAGTFAVQAAQSGSWNVTIDSGTVSLPTGAATSANQSTLISHVDGIEALLTTMDADTSTLASAVSGSEMQVDVVTLPVLPAGDNNIGNVDLASAIPAGTNNIGDVDVLTLPDAVEGPGSPVIDSYTTVAVSASANTANQSLVAAPGASKQIWVYGLVLTADTGDGSFSLQDEDDTALSGVMAVAQNGGFAISPSGNFAMPWIKVATNKALEIDTVTAGAKGILTYAVVDVS